MNAVVNFNGVELELLKYKNTWALSNRQVADGFGVDEVTIRSQKSRNEYKDGVHFYVLQNATGNAMQTFWTKKGVITLGFKLRETPQTIAFRDWASDFILNNTSQTPLHVKDANALNIIANAMQTMLTQNTSILELLKQNQKPLLADKPNTRMYHKKLSNEEKFIERVIKLLKKEEGVCQKYILETLGKRQDDRTAKRWLYAYHGIYWKAEYSGVGNTYSYSLIEE